MRRLKLNSIDFNDFYTEMSRFDKDYCIIDYMYTQVFSYNAIQIYLNRLFIGMSVICEIDELRKEII